MLAATDKNMFASDKQTRALYAGRDTLLWFGDHGASDRIETLLHYAAETVAAGTDTTIFNIGAISRDMVLLRTMYFTGNDSINIVAARIEYNLTRAYLRYASTQHYGFVNGSWLLNHLEEDDTVKTGDKYRHLYDIPLERPDKNFYNRALRMTAIDSFYVFMQELQPREPLYYELVKLLATAPDSQREKIICNIERCRWRQKDYPVDHTKRVVVNIPSFSLYATDGDSTMIIRIICGSGKTKSPLLTSSLKRIDLNPRWIVPISIAKGIVYDTTYLKKENMYIHDKQLGRVSMTDASLSKVMAHEQYIVQEQGDKNSLGRIIFRFDNNFAIYLHHTSTPWLFERLSRAYSHGCIRVEKPIDLARFLLGKGKEDLCERIEYSFTTELDDDDDAKSRKRRSRTDRSKMVNTVNVEPQIPLFINYYTYYYDAAGNIVSYDDIYGYDKVIIEALKPYTQRGLSRGR